MNFNYKCKNNERFKKSNDAGSGSFGSDHDLLSAEK